MIFGQFVLGAIESNAFIVGCPETREALLVDAGAADPRFKVFLECHGLRLTTVFITHQHWDHTDGLAALAREFRPAVYSHLADVAGVPATTLRHGDVLSFGRIDGHVVSTPGHTPDGMSLILPGMVFTGDALFAGSVGGTGTPEDAARQLEAIRQHIFTLPGHYEVHVGHGPSTTVAVERDFNPFFHP